jgi:Na+-driven multidrug efflux pump
MMLGISPFIMNTTESILQISFNNQLALYGGSMAVASMSILMSLYQIITMPLSGIVQGGQPIMSYNFGAQNYARVKDTFKLEFKICLGYSVVVASMITLFSPFFAGVFSSDPLTIEFTSWAIRVYLAGGILFGAQVACQQSFMALGQAKRSLLMALFRKVVLLIPLIYILPVVLGESAFAWGFAKPITDITIHGAKTFCVLLAEPISDILAATATTALFVNFYKKSLSKDEI